ncbi:MAG: response regulator transcription factor [Coriobacteriia bacterium]|nr:response regulator transcription factor [Coriobacteriia bacterium]
MQVLIVEDDKPLAQALAQILTDNGYAVDVVHDGADGLAYAQSGIYDVVVLDLMLPKMNGFDVVAQLRRDRVATPVLLLTARDSVPDKIQGLDSGADDYMTKPFSPAELMAHLRALTRRQGEVVFETLTGGDLELNLTSEDLICRADPTAPKSIHLSHREFQLAQVLLANFGAVVTRETLIAKIWGYDSYTEDNSVEAYVSFLRKKLRFLKSRTQIKTLRKVGYSLTMADEA